MFPNSDSAAAARISRDNGARGYEAGRPEDIHLGTHGCPLCGNEAPKGHRYCTDCDEAGSYATSESGGSRGTRHSAPAARRGSNVPLILLFFVVSAFGTVLAGFFAPSVLSLPLLGEVTVPTVDSWGEIRIARATSNIRARATMSSEVIGKLTEGDTVRVEPAADGWFRIYESRPVRRPEAKPLGFVFGKLLISTEDL